MARPVEEVRAFTKTATLLERETSEDIDLCVLIRNVLAREAPDNAIQIEICDINPDLEIHAKTENDRVRSTFSTVGHGVHGQALSRQFEPFHQPDTARGRHTGGSGLGITQLCIEPVAARFGRKS